MPVSSLTAPTPWPRIACVCGSESAACLFCPSHADFHEQKSAVCVSLAFASHVLETPSCKQKIHVRGKTPQGASASCRQRPESRRVFECKASEAFEAACHPEPLTSLSTPEGQKGRAFSLTRQVNQAHPITRPGKSQLPLSYLGNALSYAR